MGFFGIQVTLAKLSRILVLWRDIFVTILSVNLSDDGFMVQDYTFALEEG